MAGTRSQTIDALKGIAILIVMVGHVLSWNHMEDGYLYDAIKVLQMPLFMIVSVRNRPQGWEPERLLENPGKAGALLSGSLLFLDYLKAPAASYIRHKGDSVPVRQRLVVSHDALFAEPYGLYGAAGRSPGGNTQNTGFLDGVSGTGSFRGVGNLAGLGISKPGSYAAVSSLLSGRIPGRRIPGKGVCDTGKAEGPCMYPGSLRSYLSGGSL